MERLEELLSEYTISITQREREYNRREFLAAAEADEPVDRTRQAIIDHVTSLIEAAKKEGGEND